MTSGNENRGGRITRTIVDATCGQDGDEGERPQTPYGSGNTGPDGGVGVPNKGSPKNE